MIQFLRPRSRRAIAAVVLGAVWAVAYLVPLAEQAAAALPANIPATRVRPLSAARPVPASWARPEPMDATTGRPTGGGQGHAMQSTNWSGYVASGTDTKFTGATGSWTVPQVHPGPAGYSSSWVGIDGTGTQDLIQAGTEQDWGPQGVVYYAWYEVLPASSMYLGPVYPGDQVSVDIDKAGPASWTIQVHDITRGTLWAGAVSYTAPGNSAEWVEEAPTNGQNSRLYPLANFGTVQFSGLGVAGRGTAAATLSPVYMVAGTSGRVEAYPARYSEADNTFSVQFGKPASGTSIFANWPPVPLGRGAAAGSGASGAAAGGAFPRSPQATATPATSGGRPGYFLVAGDGGVFAFGSARYGGSAAAVFAGSKAAGVTGVANAPGGAGYWLVTATGGVFPLGGAPYLGSVASLNLSAGTRPSIAASPTGNGYYILAPWGDVFAFGAARFEGSCDRARCGSSPAVALIPDSTGDGYWLVFRDCKVVAFGDAPPLSSAACGVAAQTPGAGVVGTGRTPDGHGFWTLLGDGALYPFGDAANFGDWYLSAKVSHQGAGQKAGQNAGNLAGTGRVAPGGSARGSTGAGAPVAVTGTASVAVVPTNKGDGAWVVRADGSVEALGKAADLGSLRSGTRLNQPVLSATSA